MVDFLGCDSHFISQPNLINVAFRLFEMDVLDTHSISMYILVFVFLFGYSEFFGRDGMEEASSSKSEWNLIPEEIYELTIRIRERKREKGETISLE